MGLPSHYSICSSQLKYQMNKILFNASVLLEQLLSSVPYATLCAIPNGTFMSFVYMLKNSSITLVKN